MIFFLSLFGLCLVGCDTNITSLPKEMLDDFVITLTFDFNGYYDLKTGVLKNGYYELDCKYETILLFSEDELKETQELFLLGSIDRWPEK